MKIRRDGMKVGVLVPFTNSNLEPDMMLMCPQGMSLHFNRLGGYDQHEIPDSGQMASMGSADIDESLRLLCGVKPDAILYGCTSATLTHGVRFDSDLAAKIGTLSGAKTITAAGALVYALSYLNVKQIGFASPYVAEINDQAIAFLSDAGIQTVSRGEVSEVLNNTGQGAMTPEAVFALGLQADSPEAEAIVLSCTDMRSVEVISALEKAINKPVVASNQAMLFQTMQVLGIQQSLVGFGRLLQMSSSLPG